MKLTEAISYIEPYTVICLTHKNMTEDWYRSLRFIPEPVKGGTNQASAYT